jgi:hypothetical protein
MRPGRRIVAQSNQQLPDPILQLLGEAACGHNGLDGGGPEGVDDAPSCCSGEEEGAAQQPGVDGGQHAAPVGLSLLEGAGWF